MCDNVYQYINLGQLMLLIGSTLYVAAFQLQMKQQYSTGCTSMVAARQAALTPTIFCRSEVTWGTACQG
jgi:hypothetical protein